MSKSDKEKHPEQSPEEKLRIENEIEKLKLSAFHGAEFFSKNELPPEVENEWLKYIAHFEKKWEDVERITVAEKLGHPGFPAVESLTEAEIAENLDNVQQLMARHGLFLDTIAEVPAVEIYRFITEELFQQEIDDIDIEGLQTVFIYEEFYPNDELDIEQVLTDFISEMLGKKFQDYLHLHLSESCQSANGKTLSAEAAAEKAISYSELYDHFEIDTVTNFQIEINETETEAYVTFFCSYRAVTNNEATPFEGEATATMAKGKLGYWNIETLSMPGFAL